MDQSTKKKPRKPLEEEQKKKKKETDKKRDQTRVNIGRAFEEWREVREEKDCKTDADLAVLLLKFYKRWQTGSTPSKRPRCLTEDSDLETQLANPDIGVQPIKEEGRVCVLDSRVKLEDECDSPDEGQANNLRESMNVRANTPEMSMEGAPIDFEMPESHDEEPDNIITEQHKVLSEEDLVGKKTNIAFNDNLLALAKHLTLPVKKCKHQDIQSGACPGAQPFQVTLKPRGTGVIIEWLCLFGHTVWRWNSQPTLKFGMQGGDFMLTMNILLSGNNYRKVALLFKFMNMGMVAEGTYFRIKDAYCIEPVQEYWDKTRAEVLERFRQKDHAKGDGGMDSPAIDNNGHNQRQSARNRVGHKIYKRSYNKRSKTWSVRLIKEKKQYDYIPEIQKAILSRRLRSGTGLPRKITARPDDPRRLSLHAPPTSAATTYL